LNAASENAVRGVFLIMGAATTVTGAIRPGVWRMGSPPGGQPRFTAYSDGHRGRWPAYRDPDVHVVAAALLLIFAAVIAIPHAFRVEVATTADHFQQAAPLTTATLDSMRPLRKLQSGNIRDYVAWFVFGIAFYGALLLLLARSNQSAPNNEVFHKRRPPNLHALQLPWPDRILPT
jgi:hypothetical protein